MIVPIQSYIIIQKMQTAQIYQNVNIDHSVIFLVNDEKLFIKHNGNSIELASYSKDEFYSISGFYNVGNISGYICKGNAKRKFGFDVSNGKFPVYYLEQNNRLYILLYNLDRRNVECYIYHYDECSLIMSFIINNEYGYLPRIIGMKPIIDDHGCRLLLTFEHAVYIHDLKDDKLISKVEGHVYDNIGFPLVIHDEANCELYNLNTNMWEKKEIKNNSIYFKDGGLGIHEVDKLLKKPLIKLRYDNFHMIIHVPNNTDIQKNQIEKPKTQSNGDELLPEHECCICLNYTSKSMLLVPCGHRQYCKKCIETINKCSLCNANIESKIKVY